MSAKPIEVKKTSSQGYGCLLLFGLVFLCAGLGVGFVVVRQVHQGYRAHTEYLPVTCTIVSKQVVVNSDSDGSTYRPEFTFRYRVPQGIEEGSGPEMVVTGYDGTEVSSSGRAGKEEIVAQYNIGSQYTCWYDPKNPNKAVLVKPSRWHLLWLLFPLPFVGFGLFAVIYPIRQWIRGPQIEAPKTPVAGVKAEAPKWAKRLADGQLQSEPGASLACRLKPEQTEKAAALGLGIFGLIWTGLTGGFWIHLLNQREWIGVVFLGLFVLVGFGILAAAIWQALIGWGVGETRVEVSSAELAPGESFEVLVAQSGRNLKVNRLAVYLVCEEKATYRQGTSTRTDTEIVHDELQTERSAFVVSGHPEELRCKVSVPSGAMHSFDGESNKIIWKLCVKGDIERWPDFKREYVVKVTHDA